ncbi:hypothetical protein FJZ36_10385 [Candidatus Poribacteria bacterium]|nr:hypothetical protein [Candidatus Poribacteria bacterium]
MERNASMDDLSAYDRAIINVFEAHYVEGMDYFEFEKDELRDVLTELNLHMRNIPDIPYTFRTRRDLPDAIRSRGNWAIVGAGLGKYAFRRLTNLPHFEIALGDYEPINIYNAIPEVIDGYLRRDEQSLLTRVLYNRLADIFTGLTCFHLQNHYRSTVQDVGEVELDALYVGSTVRASSTSSPLRRKDSRRRIGLGACRCPTWQGSCGRTSPN